MYCFALLFTPSCRLTNDNIKSSSLPAETAGTEGLFASTTQNSDAEDVLEAPQKGGKHRSGGGLKKAAALRRRNHFVSGRSCLRSTERKCYHSLLLQGVIIPSIFTKCHCVQEQCLHVQCVIPCLHVECVSPRTDELPTE